MRHVLQHILHPANGALLTVEHLFFPGPNVVVIAYWTGYMFEEASHTIISEKVVWVAAILEFFWCSPDKCENVGRDGGSDRRGERGPRDEDIFALPVRGDFTPQCGEVICRTVTRRVQVLRTCPFFLCSVYGKDTHFLSWIGPSTVSS